MNAPDKIYLHPDIGGKEFIRPWLKRAANSESVAYIRKDALLEWAKKKNKRIDTEDGDYSLGYVSAVIDLILQLVNLEAHKGMYENG